jgi:hypothetical protein
MRRPVTDLLQPASNFMTFSDCFPIYNGLRQPDMLAVRNESMGMPRWRGFSVIFGLA